jgi:excisionase family DNA binding protein
MEVSVKQENAIQPLLDVNQGAELMNVSPYTIRAWIRDGRLQATKLGRLVRIEPAEIGRLISAGKCEGGR